MLEPTKKQVITDIKEVVDALKLPMLVIGAGARLLIFDEPYRISGRTTTDWDIAVSLESWEKFKILCDRMTEGTSPHFRRTPRSAHKFIHINTNIEVDIVPFGEIGQPNEQIEWPDGNEMNLLGLEEALNHASQKIDDLELLVVDLSGFLALKLIAWNDRRLAKDIEDINFILEEYKIYNDDDRIYDELIDEMGGQIEFEDAATFLLGKDIRHRFSDRTMTQLTQILSQILEDANRSFPPLLRRVEGNQKDSKFAAILHDWNVFYKGMKAT